MKLKKGILLVAIFLLTMTSFSATVLIENQPANPVENGEGYKIDWLVIPENSEETITSTTLMYKNSDGTYEDISEFNTEKDLYTYNGINEELVPKKQFYKIKAETSEGVFYSMESYFVLQADATINYKEPLGTITSTTPRFSWDGVEGAAGYKLVFSASPITISTDENGDPTVEGGNIIWQVSTSKTELQYGERGDLGTEVGNPAPLSYDESGEANYYYIIMVMYGESEGSISTTIPSSSDIEKIVLEGFPTIDSTNLLFPGDLEDNEPVEISDKYVTFEWETVTNANLYHIYIEEKVDIQGIDSRALAYDEVVNGTSLDINAETTLKSGDYYWYVMTEGNDGQVAKSNEFKFTYNVPSTTVEGIVKDKDGKAMSGVEVYLKTKSGTKINMVPYITEGDGKYKVENVKSGDYYLEAILEGYTQTSINEVNVPSNPEEIITVDNIILNAKNSSFTGKVENKNSEGLGKVVVSATNYDGQKASSVTDENGYFNLKIEPGTWNISYNLEGYTSEKLLDQYVSPGNTSNLGTITLKANDLTISGIVYNDINERLQGAKVILTNGITTYETSSLSDGKFNFKVQPGEWRLSVQKLGFTPSDEKIFKLGAGENIVGEAITLIGNATIITGKVLDNYGRGVINADVSFSGTKTYNIKTDIYGKYSVSVKKGDYSILAKKNGYSQTDNISQSVGYGESVTVDINMVANTSEIQGIVFDEKGYPLSGVEINTSAGNTFTNSNGEYSLSMKDGEYNVTAKKEGYNSDGKTVSLGVGQTLEGVNFDLSKDVVNLSGKVKDKNTGELLSNVKVSIGGIESYTDNYGQYRVTLQPGIYDITFSKNNYAEKNITDLKLQSGYDISGKDIYLEKNIAYIKGRITSKDLPLKGATVKVGDTSVVTNSEGIYKVAKRVGTYDIIAQKRGYSTGEKSIIISDSDLNTTKEAEKIQLEVLPVTINGSVVDGSGRAMSNVDVVSIDTNGQKSNAVTDANGEFQLGVKPGDVTIKVNKYGYTDGSTDVEVTDNINNFVIEINDERGTVKGKITNGANSKVEIGDKVTYANSEGEYILKLASGTYDFKISKSGFKVFNDEILLNKKEIKIKDITLNSETGVLNIEVNEPETKIYINGPKKLSKTLTEKTWENIELPYGEYNISVSKENYSSDIKSVTINETPKSIVAVIQELGGRIIGGVTPRDALIIVKDGTNEIWRGYPNEYGEYKTPKLKSGDYTVIAKKEGYKDGNITAGAGTEGNDISLNAYQGQIEVSIKNTDGIDEVLSGKIILKSSGNVVATKEFNSDKVILRRLNPELSYNLEVYSLEESILIDNDIEVVSDFKDKKATVKINVIKLDTKIKLKITDGNNLLSNALITLKDNSENVLETKQSGTNGLVEFSRLKQDDYKIDIQKSGYEKQVNLSYTSARIFETETINMISNLTDIEIPIITTGAAIKLSINNNTYEKISSDSGKIIFNDLPKGEKGILKVSKGSYITKTISVLVDEGKLTDLNGNDLTNIELIPQAILTGTITNGEGARVSVDGNSTYISKDETYTIGGLSTGEKSIKISKFGYETVTITKTLNIGENLFNETLVELESDITISVKRDNLDPIENISVTLGTLDGITDVNGKVIFEKVPYSSGGTDYEVMIKKGNAVKKDLIKIDSANQSYDYILKLKEAQIKGNIDINGKGAEIKILNDAGRVVVTLNSDDNSEFDSGNTLEAGDYKLLIQKPGFNTISKKVTLESNSDIKDISSQEINLIPRYLIISGRIIDSDTLTKLQNVKIVLMDSNDNKLKEIYSTGDGTYKIQAEFDSGDYKLEFKKDGYIAKKSEIFNITETAFIKKVSDIKLEASDDTQKPEITDKTEVKIYKKGDAISFKANVTDNITVSAVKIRGSLNGVNFEKEMKDSDNDKIYEYKKELTTGGILEYQIEAFDGANTSITEIKELKILDDPSYIKVSPKEITMMKNSDRILEVKIYDKYGNDLKKDDDKPMEWEILEGEELITLPNTTSSSIKINSNDKVGKAIIEVEYKGMSDEANIEIKEISVDDMILGLDFTSNQIKAGTQIEYSLTVYPKEERPFKSIPEKINKSSDIVDIDEKKQIIISKKGKVGKVKITAYYRGKSISEILDIYEVIGNNGGTIESSYGARLTFKEASIETNKTVSIYKTEAPALPSGDVDIAGNVYKITPENLSLSEDGQLTLPIPSEIDIREYGKDSIDIYWWNGIEWEIQDRNKTVSTKGITIDISKLGTFAVMVRSEPLKIKEFEIYPNPFRPKNGGTLIRYKVTSSEQTIVYINMKVYSERGELVATIEDNEMKEKLEDYYIKWNGKSDDNKVVKNGRYIVRLEAEDISGKVSEQLAIVVIK